MPRSARAVRAVQSHRSGKPIISPFHISPADAPNMPSLQDGNVGNPSELPGDGFSSKRQMGLEIDPTSAAIPCGSISTTSCASPIRLARTPWSLALAVSYHPVVAQANHCIPM
jgi:hypothetical protein